MMKNRDTPSNPYRVPRQPTAHWIKVSIAMLFLCNATLVGGVVYLIFASRECTKACMLSSEQRPEKITRKTATNMMPQDGNENPIARQEEIIRLLTRRVDSAAEVVSGLQTNVRRIDEMCRKKLSAIGSKDSVEISASEKKSYSRQPSLQEVISQMQLKLANLGIQLEQLLTSSRQVCKQGHYRFGIYCMYVGEASIPQADAKRFCASDYDAQGTLAMIKDRFMHEFVSGKLPNRLHSYWIGIEKKSSLLAAGVPSYMLSQRNEERSALEGPVPLAADRSLVTDQSSDAGPFDYVDGTKVQNKVWQMWSPMSSKHSDSRQKRDCVALSYDQDAESWYWQDHDCGARLGYVCQYFIMTVGY